MNRTNESQMNTNYISVMKALATVSVVILHTNGYFWMYDGNVKKWTSACVIDSLFYFAVPIFYMISGATLIDYRKRYTTGVYLKKRIEKAVLPYIVWTAGIVFLTEIIKNQGLWTGVKNAIMSIINGTSFGFFIPLFGIYLSMPIISAIDEKYKDKVLLWGGYIGLIFNFFCPFICDIFHIQYNSIQIYGCYSYLFYAFAGSYIYRNDINIRFRIMIYVLGVIALGANILGTWSLTIQSGAVATLFKGYEKWTCAQYSLAVFVLLKQLFRDIKDSQVRVFNLISNFSLGIYFLNSYIIAIIVRLCNIDRQSLVWRLGGCFIVIPIVMIIIYIMRKIPLIKRIVP